MDAVQQIQSFNAGRDPERLQVKYRTLRASAFSFLRGSCHLFYDRLAGDGGSGAALPPTPLTWVCGDLHVENFGSHKADNRLVYFDINDFDESALAPAGWDLVRLLASLQVVPVAFLPPVLLGKTPFVLRSAGRAGSAGADEWIAFGRRKDWQRRLLAAAQDCAQQVQLDWAAYAAAFDAGAQGV